MSVEIRTKIRGLEISRAEIAHLKNTISLTLGLQGHSGAFDLDRAKVGRRSQQENQQEGSKMKAQAHSLRPALSCIVRAMEAVRSRFCETGADVAYLTLHRGLRPSIAPSRPRLYGLYLLGLKSLVSVKATDTGVGNLNILADNRLGESQSGFLFIRILSHLLMGVACSCDLSHGYQDDRISYTVKPCPPAVGSGRMASQLNILEAFYA